MIIRKPYAFLIKNFKLIHFFMLILSSYLLYRSNIIFTFFSNYVKTRKVIFTGTLAIDNVPNLIFIFSLLIILFSVIIYILLRQKDKPKLLYVTIILFYLSFIVFLFIAKSNINTIELKGLDPQNSRIIRDIGLLYFLIQIAYEILLVIRTIGFDIQKFHFGEDLNSLEIDITDNEEVELTTGIDTGKLIRKLKMKLEDLKEFFLENKIVIILIIIVAIFALGLTIYKNNLSIKTYYEKEEIKMEEFSLTINSSYTTTYDYRGNKILKDDNTYLIVNFSATNYSNSKRGVSFDNFRLQIEDNIYLPNITLYNNFIDLGQGYYNQRLDINETKAYIAVFIVPKTLLEKEIKIRYADKLTYINREVSASYKKIIIKPKSLDNIEKKEDIKIKNEINFSNTMLKNTAFKINSYEINNKFSYTYNKLNKYIINNDGYVMKLTYDFKMDDSNIVISNIADFMDKYVSIVYIYQNKEYTVYAKNITPSSYKDNDIYLAIDEKIKDSKSIKLVINVRNVIYTYILL